MFEPAEILPDAIPLFDGFRINQVVFNLLSNAVKYTPEGGTIHYRVAEEKRSWAAAVSIHLDIIDNGIRMSEEFQKVLFNPFTQENRRESSKMYGSGLGLAITKQLIDAMGGTISVKSRPGEGTTFLLDFLDCIPAADVDKTSEAKGAPAESLEGRHVLLCEDHPLNQEIAKAILEGKQARVTIADNGEAERKDVSWLFDRVFRLYYDGYPHAGHGRL